MISFGWASRACASSYNKVLPAPRPLRVRSDLHGPKRLWRVNGVARIVRQAVYEPADGGPRRQHKNVIEHWPERFGLLRRLPLSEDLHGRGAGLPSAPFGGSVVSRSAPELEPTLDPQLHRHPPRSETLAARSPMASCVGGPRPRRRRGSLRRDPHRASL